MLHEAEIRDMAARGMTRKQMSELLGMSYSRVSTICTELGLKTKRPPSVVRPRREGLCDRNAEIISRRKAGLSYKEIAASMGLSYSVVAEVSRTSGLGLHQDEQRTKTREVTRMVRLAGFEYVGGYTSTHAPIRVRCPVCGTEFDRLYSIFRAVANHTWRWANECPGCKQTEAAKRQEQKDNAKREAQKQRAADRKKKQADLKSRAVMNETERRLANHVCKACGRSFCQAVTGYNSTVYCSEECQKQFYYRTHERARLGRMLNKKHDKGITLRKLYDRDGGICYLCGKPCDWHDCTRGGGAFIAGPSYPTVDHVVPLSRGGLHVWANVRLCCKRCNELKGWRTPPSVEEK